MKWPFIFLMMLMAFCSIAQVQHNFQMNPENTDCHLLPDNMAHLPVDSLKAILFSKKYRFEQNVRLSRYKSPQSLSFHSCEGETGFIIAQEKADLFAIYGEVPKALWDSLTNHRDPINFYKESKLKNYLINRGKL